MLQYQSDGVKQSTNVTAPCFSTPRLGLGSSRVGLGLFGYPGQSESVDSKIVFFFVKKTS